MILYPTETVYGLGVHALDEESLAALFVAKGRDERQTVSWLVRNIADMEKYAELSPLALCIAEHFLPGPLTLVLSARSTVPVSLQGPGGTIGLRISADPIASQVVADFMATYDAPLTCTSANVSGLPTLPTPEKIIAQFAGSERPLNLQAVFNDGPRTGSASTIIRVQGNHLECLRIGSIPESAILQHCL